MPELIRRIDFRKIIDAEGLDTLESYFLFGNVPRGVNKPDQELTEGERWELKAPIDNISLCLLVRHIENHPDDNPVPRMPSYSIIKQKIKNLGGTVDAIDAKLGVLFGTSSWSAHNWSHDGEPSPPVQRLFKILSDAIDRDGLKGLERFLSTVEEELEARGLPGGVDGLIARGNWGKYGPNKTKKK